MKSRFARLGVLIASVMGLLLTSTPAEATWIKSVTFVGEARLTNCAGLDYPGLTAVPTVTTTVKNDPKGVPEVNNTVHNGNSCDFTLSTTACVKTSAGNGKKLGEDLCTIFATGRVTGFCGLSSGTGTAVLTNLTHTLTQKPDVVTDFKFWSTPAGLTVSGGTATQWVKAHVVAVPNLLPGSGSCTNKTATSFIITGDAVVKKIT